MGRIICEEHGQSGIVLVCEHVGKAVVERALLPARSTVVADLEGVVLEMMK